MSFGKPRYLHFFFCLEKWWTSTVHSSYPDSLLNGGLYQMESHGNGTRTIIFSTKLLNKDSSRIPQNRGWWFIDSKYALESWKALCFPSVLATDETTVLGNVPGLDIPEKLVMLMCFVSTWRKYIANKTTQPSFVLEERCPQGEFWNNWSGTAIAVDCQCVKHVLNGYCSSFKRRTFKKRH